MGVDDKDLKPNSHAYKAQVRENATSPSERKVQKVVKGKVTTKKNEVRKIADAFVAEDLKNVRSYLFTDVLVPAAKKLISDIVRNGVDMFLYGGGQGSNNRSNTNAGYVSYRSYSDRDRGNEPRRYESGSRLNYDDIIFDYRQDAVEVLDRMRGIREQYGFVRVSDLFDLADVSGPYTGNRYGWYSLERAKVIQTRDGRYIIDLPRAMAID